MYLYFIVFTFECALQQRNDCNKNQTQRMRHYDIIELKVVFIAAMYTSDQWQAKLNCFFILNILFSQGSS